MLGGRLPDRGRCFGIAGGLLLFAFLVVAGDEACERLLIISSCMAIFLGHRFRVVAKIRYFST